MPKSRKRRFKSFPIGKRCETSYVNGKYRGDDKIGDLMHDFNCKEAKDIKNKVLRERVRYYKEDEKGVKKMCKVMDKIVKEDRKKRDEKIVLSLLRKNMSVADISDVLDCSEAQIKKIQQKVLVEA